LVAIATPEAAMDLSKAGEYKVNVVVRNKQQEPVFQASITMWVSPKKASA
jgi:hypothetical protein